MSFFSDDFVRRVREANDIVQVIENRGVPLRRAGTNMVGLCPFHREKTPSFNVRPVEQYYRCFGCDAKGDVISFVMRHDRLDFPGAVAELARAAGLPPEEGDSGERRRTSRDAARRDVLFWANLRALEWFEECLADADPSRGGAAARRYLLDRGFTEATLRAWRLGWAPDAWDGLRRRLTDGIAEADRRGRMLEYAVAGGLLRRKVDERTGEIRYYDAFRGRVMFPILDIQRRPVGFGGRVLVETEHSGGKYVNSSEGKLFEKRKILFGLPQAARAIGEAREAIIVEGYTDAIMCHQHGIENVVATLGTALTEEHIRTLRRHVGPQGRVVVFFDNDAAGEKATDRAIRLFLTEDVALAVARGLSLKDACAFLPRYGAGAFREQLAGAEDAFAYVLRTTVGAARTRDVPIRAAAAKAAADLVNTSPDPIKRAYMRKTLAAEAGVPENALPPERSPAVPETAAGRPAGRRSGGAAQPDSDRFPPRGGIPAGWRPESAAARADDRIGRPGGRKMRASARESKPGLDAVAQALAGAASDRRRRYTRLLAHMWVNAHWAERVTHELPPDEILDAACAEVAAGVRDAWQAGRAPVLAELLSGCAMEGSAELLLTLAADPGQAALPPSEGELRELLVWVERERLSLRLREASEALKAAEKDNDAEAVEALLTEILALRQRLTRTIDGKPL